MISLISLIPKLTSSYCPPTISWLAKPPSWSNQPTTSQLMVDLLVGWSISWKKSTYRSTNNQPTAWWTTKQFMTNSLNSHGLPRDSLTLGHLALPQGLQEPGWSPGTTGPGCLECGTQRRATTGCTTNRTMALLWLVRLLLLRLGCWCRHINSIHRIVASLDAILEGCI